MSDRHNLDIASWKHLAFKETRDHTGVDVDEEDTIYQCQTYQ